MTSLAESRRRGVREEAFVCVGLGAAAHESEDPLARDSYDHSSSMAVSIKKALTLNGVSGADLDHVELYSCFPCVPKMARRVLSWPVEKPTSVFGGLTFGGGPIGNYMSHAVVSMVLKLRVQGRYGLLFTNGGFATHNHTIIISSAPVAGVSFPQSFDYQDDADLDRRAVPALVEDYAGPATIETYTVLYQRDGTAKWGGCRSTDARWQTHACQGSRRGFGHHCLSDRRRRRTGWRPGPHREGGGWRAGMGSRACLTI